MYWMKIQSRHENAVYMALWGMLFAAPVLSLYVRSISLTIYTFQWSDVFMIWKSFVVYLLLFLVHNFVLAPILIHRQKRLLYFSLVAVILSVFIVYQCSHRPQPLRHGPPPMEKTHKMERPKEEQFQGERFEGEHHEGERLQGERHEGRRPPEFRQSRRMPPVFLGEHVIATVVFLVLMFGMNLGVKGYFKGRSDQKKLAELQKENLAQQLEYLKYQINPHFFMNTLNNIHALVDIDPEKAKSTILELSKMMRFILYEGDKNGVPLTREFDFIRNYITLMRLRYTDKVRIQVDLPDAVPDKTLPPLMLISFIENAFKHGISYQRPSFIEISVDVNDNRLHFTCYNSKADTPNQEKGGVGLTNVKQRLKLLYDSNFTLHIDDNPDTYRVELTIPLNA